MPEQRNLKDTQNVRVVVRCRPMNETEKSSNCKLAVQVDSARGSLTIQKPGESVDSAEHNKTFTFDLVFGPDCKQLDVYNEVARPLVDCVLDGYNGTIFAYGQTGTGKTFTMEGVRSVPELRGIIPNSFAHIFGHIAKAEGDTRFLVRVSYLEIYNEEVRDLLGKDQDARLEVKERPDTGVYVKDLSAFVVNTADDMDRIMSIGNKNRSVGATNMNQHSSRSHAIFTVTIECSEKGGDGEQHVRVGKLHLVDLAGSERQSKTGATGQRLKEATKINLSLSTLGNVISALVDGKSSHIPYRNSKLTRLLQDSLGGNSKTVMCANCGPADYNYDETISTLRYANRAKNIKNNAKINEDPKDALLRQFQQEIELLRKQLEDGGGGAGASGDEEGGSSGDDDDEDIIVDGQPQKKKKQKFRRTPGVGRHIPREKMQEIEAKIENDRRLLAEKKDMAEEERNRVKADLDKKEAELKKAQDEQAQLASKLQALERKIIVGGENLLEKAEEQQRLLEESAAELQRQKEKEARLHQALQLKEQERLDVEEKYTSLQEEKEGKTKKLKKVWSLLQAAKAECDDLKAEQQREMEGLLDSVRLLSRELRLQMLVIDHFVPAEYQELLQSHVHWNEDIGEWQLKCVAYTGNNMRKQTPLPPTPAAAAADKAGGPEVIEDLSHVYLTYGADGAGAMPVREAVGGGGGSRDVDDALMGAQPPRRPKTPGSARPKTATSQRR